ncbi:conserved hypothetical protein [Ricinus communis]|uniref:Uncharacterized protein n=1 Tax=Ricinus communis TaxID=3988 RepID=B9RL80_RICCO|nr:conserved hypothetical protein [Ricinus communis]
MLSASFNEDALLRARKMEEIKRIGRTITDSSHYKCRPHISVVAIDPITRLWLRQAGLGT